MAYIFVADDFTGASDTLATLARGGMRARLFRDLPVPADLDGIEAWGIATDARSLGRDALQGLAQRIGTGLAPTAPRFLHLKICSTFDSGPEVGNIASLAQTLAEAVGIKDIAVLGGQPSLGRYTVFATLFARGPDGLIHRIDRHPVMSAHPVTPMHEADLIRHLAALGLNGLHLVIRGQGGCEFPRFYDALDRTDVEAAGRDLLASARPVLVMGASSVAEGWLATQPARMPIQAATTGAKGPVLAFAGSRSSLTAAQVDAAESLARLPIDPADLMAEGPKRAWALDWACSQLAHGQHCLLHLTAETSGATVPADLANSSASFVRAVLARGQAGALVVAGGDTSSAIINALSPDWLDYAADLCPGVPVLNAKIGDTHMPLALKGGQMGPADFFAKAVSVMTAGAH